MRGKHGRTAKRLVAVGITPAHAGKTGGRSGRAGRCGDHPRACGENLARHKKTGGATGSPPRMRGKQLLADFVVCALRITPACAGKTPESLSSHFPTTNHPRVCGENYSWDIDKRCDYGSPPRVRGKPAPRSLPSKSPRITPACAGKTKKCARRILSSTDHPRVCGENYQARCKTSGSSGSPPRVRGKLLGFLGLGRVNRITPACAGKTLLRNHPQTQVTDHPRVCGENVLVCV